MSIPTTVFIDTSIFDESMYNFESASMRAFKESIAFTEITLLMPDPTQREIQRHMKEKAEKAAETLKLVERKNSFLRKLPDWPFASKEVHILGNELGQILAQEFEAFLDLFEMIELDYEGVKINEIMNWYDSRIAPFSEKKRGEFPDAFAIAVIEHYRASLHVSVAVIAKDPDFERACERISGFIYFPSLVGYSEALQCENERLAAIKTTLECDSGRIQIAVNEAFCDSEFTIEANWDGEASDVEVTDTDSLAFHVVNIGEDSCTVAFEGKVGYDVYISYGDLNSATYDGGEAWIHHTIKGIVEETAEISGVLMLRIADMGKAIEEIESVTLDQQYFIIDEVPNQY